MCTYHFLCASSNSLMSQFSSISKQKREIIFCLLNKPKCLIKGSDWLQRQQKQTDRIKQPECNGKRRHRISHADKLAQPSSETHISCRPHPHAKDGTDRMGTFRYVPGTPLSRHHLAKLGQTPQESDYLNSNKTLLSKRV